MHETKNIKKMLEEGKTDEARAALDNLVAQNLSENERGEIMVDTMTTLVDAMTEVNEGYVKNAESYLKTIADIDKKSAAFEKLEKKIADKKNSLKTL